MKNMDRKGVWSMSRIPLVLYSVLLLTILYMVYMEYSKMLLYSQLLEQSESITCLINSAGACTSYCRLETHLPYKLSGRDYTVEISGNTVSVAVDGFIVNRTLIFPVSGSVNVEGGSMIVFSRENADKQIRVEDG